MGDTGQEQGSTQVAEGALDTWDLLRRLETHVRVNGGVTLFHARDYYGCSSEWADLADGPVPRSAHGTGPTVMHALEQMLLMANAIAL